MFVSLQGDVAQLLTAYKEAVLRYETLSLAVSARASAAAAAAPSEAPAALPTPLPSTAALPPQQQPGVPQPTLLPPLPAAAAAQQVAGAAAAAQTPTAQAPASPVTFNIPVDMPTSSEQPPAAAAPVAPVQPPTEPGVQEAPEQQSAAPVENPMLAAAARAGMPAEGPSPAQEAEQAATATTSAVSSTSHDEGLSEYPMLAAERTHADASQDGAAPAADAPLPDSTTESPQFIAVSTAAAASVPDVRPATAAAQEATTNAVAHPAAEQSSAPAAPSDSVRSMDGSAAEAEAAGDTEERGRADGLAAAAAVLPEAAADEEAELAGPLGCTSHNMFNIAWLSMLTWQTRPQRWDSIVA